jgi:IS605 OrfB family transposase
MIITRKITLYPFPEDKENVNNIYKQIREWSYQSYKLANEVYSVYYMNLYLKLNIKDIDKKELNSKIANLYDSKSEQNIGYCISKKYDLPSHIRMFVSSKAYKDFKNDTKEIMRGDRSCRNYKREGFPIYFSQDGIFELKDDFYFTWVNKIKFKVNLGRDKQDNRVIINRILDGEYKFCDSAVKIEGKKIILLASINIPEKTNKLNDNLSVGVDVGVHCLAYCGLSEGQQRQAVEFGNGERSLISTRNRYIKEIKELQYKVSLAKGGKGRKRKTKAIERLKKNEVNFMKTKNHEASKKIIQFALKNNAGCIKMEKLTGITENTGNYYLGRRWSYFQLQTMVEYKAKMNGIKCVYINPKNTSKTCSKCGNINKDLTLSDRIYVCECGNSLDRDYNASLNIARSNEIL